MRRLAVLALVPLSVLIACGHSKPLTNAKDRSHVIAQICLPLAEALDSSVVVLSSIDKALISSRGTRLSGSTVANQPVFETFLSAPGEARFLVVDRKDPFVPVFAIPREVASGAWTTWRSATYLSKDDGLTHLLLHGDEPKSKYAPPADAPRVRYQVMPFSRYLDRVGTRREQGPERAVPTC